jgi:hypothetical protein
MRVGQVLFVAAQLAQAILVYGQSQTTAMRVASVNSSPDQPQQQDKAVIFFDDFDQRPDGRSRYFEYSPTNRCSIHGLLNQCMEVSGVTCAMPRDLAAGSVQFTTGFG